MSEESRTSTRQFVEVGSVHLSGESTSEGEDKLQSQLFDQRMFSSESKINAIVAPLATQLETLMLSVGEIRERSLNRLTEVNAASERSRSSVQHSDTHTCLITSDAVHFSLYHAQLTKKGLRV